MPDKADAVVVGAGIVGLFTAYMLSRMGYDVIVVEKMDGPGKEATSRNAGVIHVLQPPFDSLKSRLCIQGNLLYHKLDEELGLGVRWVNAYLALKSRLRYPLAIGAAWYLRRKLPKPYTVRVVDGRYVRSVEPEASREIKIAIEVLGYGVVDPESLARKMAGLVEERASISYNDRVMGIEVRGDNVLVEAERGEYKAGLLVNSAGLHADEVAAMTGDSFRIYPVKGVMTVYSTVRVNSIITWLKLDAGRETKGGGVIPHRLGTLLGPNYAGVAGKDDYSYSGMDLAELRERFQPLLEAELRGEPHVIVGLRATTIGRDFHIGYSKRSKRIIHLIGIESPGLTAAPAIARLVARMARGVLPK